MRLALHNLSLFDGLQPRLQGGRIVILQGRAIEAVASEADKLADLIAVRGNPLENLDCLTDVDLVIKDGKVECSRLAGSPAGRAATTCQS